MTKQEKIQKAIEAYKLVETLGTDLATQCEKEIKPLLNENKFDEAKKYVRTFFGEAYDENGCCVFIEADLINANINRLKRNYEKSSI